MKQIEVDALEEKLDKIPARSIENADGRAYALIRLSTVFEIIKQMPPAKPEREKGKWSDGYRWQRCSLCKQTGKKSWNYCPNCGADMRGEPNETD